MRLSSRKLASVLAAALASAGISACAPGEEALTQADVSCGEEKCDGWNKQIDKLWSDFKLLDLNDLLKVATKLGVNELNSALKNIPYADIKVGEPKSFGTAEQAAQDLTLGNLDKLVSGLATKFGEKELSTEVNRIRANYLRSSGRKEVFGESGFRLGAQFQWNRGFEVGGFANASVNVGFSAGAAVDVKLIGAYPAEWKAQLVGPLKAIAEYRGFVMPRDIDDIRGMAPGESLTLAGAGQLGMNLGLSTPILVGDVSGVSYNLVFNAALRTLLRGNLDVQLIRMEGDQVIVDVGIEKAAVAEASVGVHDEWGVKGLLKTKVRINGVGIDLDKLADKTLKKVLNRSLDLVDGRLSYGVKTNRASVARFRFSLEGQSVDGAVDQAIALAMRGDLRLAQALAAQENPAVKMEFDLTRSGVSTTFSAGLDLVGMSFLYERTVTNGEISMLTPGGARALLFNSIHRDAGFLWSDHGYTRTGIGGLILENGATRNEANLFVEIGQGDSFMTRDKLLDNLDGLILAVGGQSALDAIETKGNEIERIVFDACHPVDNGKQSTGVSSACVAQVLSDPRVVQNRIDATAALDHVTDSLAPSLKKVVMEAGALRLAAQAKYDYLYPKTRLSSEMSLDDASLAAVTAKSGADFQRAVEGYLKASYVGRFVSPDELASQRAEVVALNKDKIAEMRKAFESTARKYQTTLKSEAAVISGVGSIAARGIAVALPEANRFGEIDYSNIAAESFGTKRMKAATKMFDDLLSDASFSSLVGYQLTGANREQMVAFTLMSMAPTDRLDVSMNVRFPSMGRMLQLAGYSNLNVAGQGDKVSRISAGVFDVDSLVKEID